MFANFARRPIAQQLIMATISAFVVVFAALIVVMQQKAESAAIAVSASSSTHATSPPSRHAWTRPVAWSANCTRGNSARQRRTKPTFPSTPRSSPER